MKKATIIIYACAATILLTQCAKKISPAGKSNMKSKTAAEEVAEEKGKYTEAQIGHGAIIFQNNCEKCHKLKQPAEFTVKQWDKILPDMSGKAKLNKEDAGILRAWVVTNAKAG